MYFQRIFHIVDHGKDKVDFDMIIRLPNNDAADDSDVTGRSKRAVILQERLKWPQVVPYQFAFGQNQVCKFYLL